MNLSAWSGLLSIFLSLLYASANLQNTCQTAFKELQKSYRLLGHVDPTPENPRLIDELDNFLKIHVKLKERLNAASKKSKDYFCDELQQLLDELKPKIHVLALNQIIIMNGQEQLLADSGDDFVVKMQAEQEEMAKCVSYEEATRKENEIMHDINEKFQLFDSTLILKQKSEDVLIHLLAYKKNLVFGTGLDVVLNNLTKAIDNVDDKILEFHNIVTGIEQENKSKFKSFDDTLKTKVYPLSHFGGKEEEGPSCKASKRIAIEFLETELDTFSMAKKVCSDLSSRCLLINSGSYVTKNSPKIEFPQIADKKSGDVHLTFRYEATENLSIGVLTCSPLALADESNSRLVDRAAKGTDWLMVKPLGYIQLKARIYLQFQLADELQFDTIVVSALYGAGEEFKNHPGNISIAYTTAARLFFGSSVKKIVFVGQRGDPYSEKLKELLKRIEC